MLSKERERERKKGILMAGSNFTLLGCLRQITEPPPEFMAPSLPVNPSPVRLFSCKKIQGNRWERNRAEEILYKKNAQAEIRLHKVLMEGRRKEKRGVLCV